MQSTVDLAASNAERARASFGSAKLLLPSDENDAWVLRRSVLLRSTFPAAAPPPLGSHHPGVRGPSSPPSAVGVAGQLRIERSHDGNNSQLSTATGTPGVPVAAAATVNPSLVGTALEATGVLRKRDRQDGAEVFPGAGDRRADTSSSGAIVSVDPRALRDKALAVGGVAATVPDEKPLPKWKLSKVLVGHQGWVWAAAVHSSNLWFATGGGDSVIKVWDVTSGALQMNLTGHKEGVRAIAFSSDRHLMFSGSDDHAVKCWDLEKNIAKCEFNGHKGAVHCIAAHPKLGLVFSGSRDKTVRVWDLRSPKAVHVMTGHTDSVMTVCTQQMEPQVVSGGSDCMLQLWDLAAGKAIARLSRHKKPVRGLAVHPADGRMLSCAADTVRLWALPSGLHLAKLPSEWKRTQKMESLDVEAERRWTCCAISPRNVAAVGSQDGHLYFYDWTRQTLFQASKTKSLPGTLPGEGGVNAMVFDTSGTRLFTAESDKSVKIWRAVDPTDAENA